MPDLGFSSFRARLLFGVLIPVFLIHIGNAAIELFELKRTYENALQVEGDLVTHLVGEAMVLPLWDFDMPQIEAMIDRLMGEGRVSAIRLIGPDQSILAQSQAVWYSSEGQDLTISHRLLYSHSGQDEMLGELFVTFPKDSVTQALSQAIFQKILIACAVVALIALSMFVVLTRLSRPLATMVTTIVDVTNGNFDTPIPEAGRNDEIGMVAQALDRWRKNEAEVIDLRAQNDESSRRERKRIRRALESTHDAVLLSDEKGQVVFCNPNAAQFFDGAKTGRPMKFDRWMDQTSAVTIDQNIKTQTNFQHEAIVAAQSHDDPRNLLIRGGPIQDSQGGFLGTVVLATDQTDQAREAERAKYLSEHDSLTGLPNRRLMEETLDRWVLEDQQDTAILLADLDRFKLINDTLGHPVGDALLRHVARVFKDCIGDHELAARLGGDEFAILARGSCGEAKLCEIAKCLIDRLAEPQQVDGRVLHTGLSIGISTVEASDTNALDGMRRADLALYEAKNNGRGCFEVFQSDLEAVIHRKSLLEAELRKALQEKAIFPAYQMQTDLGSGQIIGFEALARWTHPTLGNVSPAEFIAIAEDSGLINTLTYQIMTQACEAARDWEKEGFEGRVAVNLSPRLFGGQVEEFVSDCLFVTGCPASAIEVEITETVVLANGSSARQDIEALQKLGVTIALDDFGMGYSSLSYLQKFPVDKIKVDRAFVSKLPESAETRAIVRAITDLGHALGMRVTGEGAETEEHRNCLRDCNVDYLQGYVDGRPMNKEDATIALLSNLSQKDVA